MKSNLKIIGGRILSILFAIFLTACGSGGGGGSDSGGGGNGGGNGGGATNATITGTVAGTTVVAVDENDNEVDRDTATGSPKTFTLTIPIGGKYKFYFIENEGTSNVKISPLYQGQSNVFSINSAITINLGFVDTTTGLAVPTNNPFSQGATDAGEDTTNPIVTINVASYANLAGRWEYQRTVPPSTVTPWALEVLGIISKNEKDVFLLQEYDEDGDANDQEYSLTDMSQGLFRVGGANHIPGPAYEEFFYQPEMPYLLSVFVPGQEYTYNFTRTDYVGTVFTHTVKIEPVSVTVPAGTYTDCYKSTLTVTYQLSDTTVSITHTHWYANNIGLVKRVQSDNGNIWELTSYIP